MAANSARVSCLALLYCTAWPNKIKKRVARLLVLLGTTSHFSLQTHGHRGSTNRNPWQDFLREVYSAAKSNKKNTAALALPAAALELPALVMCHGGYTLY
jgi:hypothetical protein